jgi:phosphoribosylanthranilate isomerase
MQNKRTTTDEKYNPQVKICGITRKDEAIECAVFEADAIGCVFYSKSPRHLTDNQAKEICLAVPKQIKTVGVFVNETFSNIMRRVDRCRLSAVQLHGQESPSLISRLRKENLLVIKVLFINDQPSLNDVSNYDASAFLLECGKGKLPGGNALEWNWESAKDFGNRYPLIIAGGLTPENVSYAIKVSAPHAVDVSSGVERSPGRKDLAKVAAFMNAVSQHHLKNNFKYIF